MQSQLSELFRKKVDWEKTNDDDFPFEAEVEDQQWKIRINDFPREPLYTLFIGKKSQFNFDDWPINWDR